MLGENLGDTLLAVLLHGCFGGSALRLVELAVLVGVEALDELLPAFTAFMAAAFVTFMALGGERHGGQGQGGEGREDGGEAHGWFLGRVVDGNPSAPVVPRSFGGVRVGSPLERCGDVGVYTTFAFAAQPACPLKARLTLANVIASDPAPALAKEQRLTALLAGHGSVLVGFSAGVDSTYLLDVAHGVLGDRVTAVTADSPSLTRSSLAEAETFCRERGIRHAVVPTAEFEVEAYRANDGKRCYHCKAALLKAMNGLARATADTRGAAALLLGAIVEDFGDVRPGLQAAAEAGASWPLADAGFTKADVRERSKARGLVSWNRAAEPCLSSRVPYGEPVTPAVVRMIEAAEIELKQLGLHDCRARHHTVGNGRGTLCRIEVPERDLERVLAARTTLLPALRKLGYTNVTLDLAGLVSGGLNALLTPAERSSALPTGPQTPDPRPR